MFGKFHNSEYDGVVLKLPSWFIDMNGLKDMVSEIHSKLEACEMSRFHPDHTNNLYELENYRTKTEKLNAEKEKEKNILDARAERQRKLISGEIYELGWKKFTQILDREGVRLGKDLVSYESDEYLTPKWNLKSEFAKKFHATVNSLDTLKHFAVHNCSMLNHHLQYVGEGMVAPGYSLYSPGIGQLGISYEMLMVKVDWERNKNGDHQYYRSQMIQFEDGCLGINKGGNFEDYIRLEGYERVNMELRKKL